MERARTYWFWRKSPNPHNNPGRKRTLEGSPVNSRFHSWYTYTMSRLQILVGGILNLLRYSSADPEIHTQVSLTEALQERHHVPHGWKLRANRAPPAGPALVLLACERSGQALPPPTRWASLPPRWLTHLRIPSSFAKLRSRGRWPHPSGSSRSRTPGLKPAAQLLPTATELPQPLHRSGTSTVDLLYTPKDPLGYPTRS